MATETKTFYPMAHAADSVFKEPMTNSTIPIGVGVDNWDGAAGWDLVTGTRAETYVFWPFDVSVIPFDATVDSVKCKAVVFGTTTYLSSAQVQLFSGDTAKGSPTNYNSSTGDSVRTLTPGSWTRDELRNIRLRVYSKRVSSYPNVSISAYFGGADLTVTYTYQSEKFMLKLGGAWHDIARVFKKVSGIWVEQTDLANVIEDGVRYQNGGEYVSPVKKISFTINGTSYQAEEGMTWGEWVASSYNTAGYQIVYNETQSGIADASGTKVVFDLGNRIFPPSTDAIANGREYTLLQA